MIGSGGVTVLMLLDSAIGSIIILPFKTNSGVAPMIGPGGVTELILLDSAIGKFTIPPFNIIGGAVDRPDNELPETCANNGISIFKYCWHLKS